MFVRICTKIFDLAIDQPKNTIVTAASESENASIVPMTEFVSTEMHVVEVYTRNMFKMVRKNLIRQGLCYEVDKIQVDEYTMKYFLEKYDRQDSIMVVEYKKNQKVIWNLKDYHAHIFKIMILEHMNKIPDAIIWKRWTKSVMKEKMVNRVGLREKMS